MIYEKAWLFRKSYGRINAADLDGHRREGFLTQMFLQALQGAYGLIPPWQLFNQNRGRPHHGRGNYKGLIGNLTRIDNVNLTAIFHGLTHHLSTDIRIAAAARP